MNHLRRQQFTIRLIEVMSFSPPPTWLCPSSLRIQSGKQPSSCFGWTGTCSKQSYETKIQNDAKCFPSDAVSHPGAPSNGFTSAGGFESAAKSWNGSSRRLGHWNHDPGSMEIAHHDIWYNISYILLGPRNLWGLGTVHYGLVHPSAK